MTSFNKYAKRLDTIAKNAFEEYSRAEKAFNEAEDKVKQYSQRTGDVDAKYTEISKTEIETLRKELETEIDDFFAADPKAIDNNTLELLRSGLLKPNEFAKIMSKVQSDGNFTMMRFVSKYAEVAAEERAKKYGQNDEGARTLRSVSYVGKQNDGKEILQAFDTLSNVFCRSVNNPALISHWGEFTSDLIETF